MFIKIVLPLIVKENNKIRVDRKRLFTILNKNSNTDIEKKWLEKKYKQYGVRKNDLSTLKVRMDEIPVSLAIAQAAKETGWGTSRFALEGNAIFGQWTWKNDDGIKPKGNLHANFSVKNFDSLLESVNSYILNLNTHQAYKGLRSFRLSQYNMGKKLIYKYDKELSFWGGNEYLFFENKFVRNTSINIRGFDLEDIYSNFLFEDFSRKNRKYCLKDRYFGGVS